ncbi:MAG: DEAD/DEAH box helicase family protein, partial [Alphaproteobacteria bacterium]
NLKEKYEKVYLLRNEEVYKIYNFENGAGFQPDFLLFLKSKNDTLHYQVFIEPKGYKLSQAKDEQRKQDFLKEITEKYGDNKILEAENKKYKLIGLPFYNKAEKELTKKFDKSFDKYILGSVEQ